MSFQSVNIICAINKNENKQNSRKKQLKKLKILTCYTQRKIKYLYLNVFLSTTFPENTCKSQFLKKVFKTEHIIKDTNAPTTNVGLKTWF